MQKIIFLSIIVCLVFIGISANFIDNSLLAENNGDNNAILKNASDLGFTFMISGIVFLIIGILGYFFVHSKLNRIVPLGITLIVSGKILQDTYLDTNLLSSKKFLRVLSTFIAVLCVLCFILGANLIEAFTPEK